MYTYNTSVKLHDADAAGLLFFSRHFKLAHDAYESFMESIGFSFANIINERDFLLLIVHAEADYRTPVFTGDRVTIKLTVPRVGETSYALSYDLIGVDGTAISNLTTVHVCVDKVRHQKKALPDSLRRALKEHA
jgi:1,4-dihydroxy-2-naphthoyl-CoA hydrolase